MKVQQPAFSRVATIEATISEDNEDTTSYIFQCVHSCDLDTVAASLSTREIKLYDRTLTVEKGVLKDLRRPLKEQITECTFSPSDPAVLACSSEDKSGRLWDIRANSIVQNFGFEEESFCCSFGLGGTILAFGVGNSVHFFDIRNTSSPLGIYTDVHSDIINQIVWHPTIPTVVGTAAEDGLACLYNTAATKTEEALVHILNADCPVRKLCFFGPQWEGLSVMTAIETLSVWHWPTARRLVDFGDMKSRTRSWATPLDYMIQMNYEPHQDSLVLSAGTFDGKVLLGRILPDDVRPFRMLQGGHRTVVRSVDFLSDTILTGGEDARLCRWDKHSGSGAVDFDTAAKGLTTRAEGGRKNGIHTVGTEAGMMRSKLKTPSYRPY